MQYWLVSEIAAIRDPAYLPAMERLLNLPCNSMRRDILQGMRAIRAQQSLRMLDDPDPEIDFIATQSLFELAGGGPIDWVPSSFDDLRLNRAYYSARCREWWQAKHPQE